MSGALVKLLHECIGSSVLTGKYCMLVMKCIWKVIWCLYSVNALVAVVVLIH